MKLDLQGILDAVPTPIGASVIAALGFLLFGEYLKPLIRSVGDVVLRGIVSKIFSPIVAMFTIEQRVKKLEEFEKYVRSRMQPEAPVKDVKK